MVSSCCNIDNQNDCTGCGGEIAASCRGRMPSFCFDIVDVVGKHFHREETILFQGSPGHDENHHVLAHPEAHQKALSDLAGVVNSAYQLAKSGNISQAFRDLDRGLNSVLDEHDEHFDNTFLRTI